MQTTPSSPPSPDLDEQFDEQPQPADPNDGRDTLTEAPGEPMFDDEFAPPPDEVDAESSVTDEGRAFFREFDEGVQRLLAGHQPASDSPLASVDIKAAAARVLGTGHNFKATPEPPPQPPQPEQQLEQQGLSLTEQATRLQITDPATFARAEELLRVLADFADRVKAFFEEDIANAYRTWNTLTTKRKAQLDPIENARKTLATRYATFDREEKARAEKKRRDDEEAARLAEQQRLDDEAAALERQAEEVPTREQAEELRQEAAQVRQEAAHVPAPVLPLQRTVAPSKGISTKAKWSFEITDKAAVVKAVAEGKLSLEALDINAVYFRARATADKGTVTIPGVRFYDAGSVSVRR